MGVVQPFNHPAYSVIRPASGNVKIWPMCPRFYWKSFISDLNELKWFQKVVYMHSHKTLCMLDSPYCVQHENYIVLYTNTMVLHSRFVCQQTNPIYSGQVACTTITIVCSSSSMNT